jgi:hypothetical protein
VVGVNPIETLSEIASSLSNTLEALSGDFENIVGSFDDSFSSTADLLGMIAESDKILLLLDASIDFSVNADLTMGSLQVTSALTELRTSLHAYISDEFDFSVGGYGVSVAPSITVYLEAENKETPFDVFANPGGLTNFSFGGTFDGMVSVGVEGVPAQITMRASSDDITVLSAFDFELRLDIDLSPIKDIIISLLTDIGELSYPSWLTKTAPFLPPLDLSCVSKAGIAFSERTDLTVSSLLSSIYDLCPGAFSLSGGYSPETEDLSINVVVSSGGSRNL